MQTGWPLRFFIGTIKNVEIQMNFRIISREMSYFRKEISLIVEAWNIKSGKLADFRRE